MGRRTTVNSIREMVTFEVGKEIEKDIFRLVTSVGQRKNSESPRGIEPQIPRSDVLATEPQRLHCERVLFHFLQSSVSAKC